MDIPAVSMSMNQIRLKQEVGMSVAKMVLDSVKAEGADLLKMMEVNMEIIEGGLNTNVGGNIDIYA
ncbi:YjfB family protein [Wansuia hejianensis]|uniref:YjfB family protein n=1 Tax=Wansuia hejianensis TaxID=2763667 RepID=A0A926IH65_9FIRM|nr:YjfB family protein [Wansuia hejianensis]MBC8590322.1 YjfB family protein [Wansuia hejianensis]